MSLTETIKVVAPNGREIWWPKKVMICGYGLGGKRAVVGPQAGSFYLTINDKLTNNKLITDDIDTHNIQKAPWLFRLTLRAISLRVCRHWSFYGILTGCGSMSSTRCYPPKKRHLTELLVKAS